MNTSTRPTAFITGASRGIGKAIAYEFAKKGYDLYLTCRKNTTLLEELKIKLENDFLIKCEIFQCDMGNYAEVEALFQPLPAFDVVINNAGISYVGLLTDMSIQEWNDVISTNLNALFYTCKFAVPKMVHNQKGRIINISSVWGNVGASMEVAYSASKGGVNSFTKALAKELAPSNIQVNAIACGVIDTDMNACFSKEDMQYLIDEIPADRLGQPTEIGKLAVLLSEAPEYLTGQVITVDGGWL